MRGRLALAVGVLLCGDVMALAAYEPPAPDPRFGAPLARSWLAPSPYRFTATVTPMCVRVGEPLTATLHLRPGASGLLVVTYADGDAYGFHHAGLAGPDGKITFKNFAGPARGIATLTSQATNGTGLAGIAEVDFRVVGLEEPC